LLKKRDIFRHKVAKRTVQQAPPYGIINLRNSGAGCRKWRKPWQDRPPKNWLPPYIRDCRTRTRSKANPTP